MEPAINSYLDESFEDYSVSGDQVVTYKKAGERRLFTNPDVDEMREYFREHKSRRMTNKVTTPQEAVSRLIADGDYLAVGDLAPPANPFLYCTKLCGKRSATSVIPVIRPPTTCSF